MNFFFTAIALISLFCMQVSHVLGDVGTATAYGPPYLPTKCYGNSPGQFPPGNLFAAVSEGLWDNGAACGRRYRLRCLSGPNRACKNGSAIEVKVVDYCRQTPCPSTIVLSNDAFNTISKSHVTVNIEYIEV